MFSTPVFRVLTLSLTTALFAAGVLGAADAGEKEESAAQKALRGRSESPKPSEIDATASLETLLAKKEKTSFSEAKGATVEGYVVQVEREEDGDFHLTLASAAREPDTRKWVIVEVTPAWQKKSASLSGEALRKLHGKKVRVTGWLFYEPGEEQPDPRGTLWEIHPVTEIVVVP